MAALIELSVRDLLAAFSSTDPTPGGGSASALSSAVGASLLMMVARLPKTRSGSDEGKAALHGAASALESVRQQLTGAIDADADAYNLVIAAYRMAKSSPEEQQARTAAIQRALREATDAPLGVLRLSVEALAHAAVVATHAYPAAASDVGVGAALLEAGATGARLNVHINLGGVKDAEYRDRVRNDVAGLEQAVKHSRARIDAALPPA